MPEVRADTAQYVFKVAGQTFQVLSFSGHEEVSGLFGYSLTLWSSDSAVDLASLIRQSAEITLTWGGQQKQFFGIVATFAQVDARLPGLGGAEEEQGIYTVQVVPTLWLLGQHRHCRIFQEKSADQIIKQVLDERGMSGKYDPRMGSYPQREYCVQYRETDLAFISRLMQEEGIFYYFTHDGKEMMVLGDKAGHWGTCSPESSVEYKTSTGVLAPADEYLSSLTFEESAYTGKVTYKDHDYRDPSKPLRVEQTAPANTDLEIYDYNVERYRDDGRGRSLAKVAVDAEAAMRKVLAASGDWRSASAGCVMSLSRAYRSDLDGDWVLLHVDHSASQEAGVGVQYSVSLTAVRKDPVFRPPQSIPKPFVNLQTATVVGPSGEKIYMDELGRAKVQFHWDPDGHNDENSSCWVRVATPYAGMDESSQKKHGTQFHPLIGDEVVVDFLDGDPDNPLIVGSVYNGDRRPIVQPSELVRNRILTPYQHQLLLDDKGGSIRLNTGGNEHLTMSDKRRQEGSVVLATCGGESLTLEDNSDTIGNSILARTANGHHVQLSDRDPANGIDIRTEDAHRLTLNDSRHRIELCTENMSYLLLDDDGHQIRLMTTGGHCLWMRDTQGQVKLSSSGGGYLEISDAGRFVEIGSATGQQKIRIDYSGTGIVLDVTAGDVTVRAPSGKIKLDGQSVEIKSSSSVQIEATSGITLKGGSKVEAEAAQIEEKATAGHKVQAMTIEHKAQTTAKLEGLLKVTVSGLMVSCEATAIATLKGALVKIN
jgi:type VI secretion system secreted protein VgrG